MDDVHIFSKYIINEQHLINSLTFSFLFFFLLFSDKDVTRVIIIYSECRPQSQSQLNHPPRTLSPKKKICFWVGGHLVLRFQRTTIRKILIHSIRQEKDVSRWLMLPFNYDDDNLCRKSGVRTRGWAHETSAEQSWQEWSAWNDAFRITS